MKVIHYYYCLPIKRRKGFSRKNVSLFVTRAGLVCHVTNTDCQTQIGSAHTTVLSRRSNLNNNNNKFLANQNINGPPKLMCLFFVDVAAVLYLFLFLVFFNLLFLFLLLVFWGLFFSFLVCLFSFLFVAVIVYCCCCYCCCCCSCFVLFLFFLGGVISVNKACNTSPKA